MGQVDHQPLVSQDVLEGPNKENKEIQEISVIHYVQESEIVEDARPILNLLISFMDTHIDRIASYCASCKELK